MKKETIEPIYRCTDANAPREGLAGSIASVLCVPNSVERTSTKLLINGVDFNFIGQWPLIKWEK